MHSPHAWFAKFNGLLSIFGFTSCLVDLTVLTKKTKCGLVILAVYVDDILLIGSDETNILATKAYLQHYLIIRDLGSPRYFIMIYFTHKGGKLALTQGKYALDMLKRWDFVGASQRPHPYKFAHNFRIFLLYSLRMITIIKDCWETRYISLSLMPTSYTWWVFWGSSWRNLDEFIGR